jgi:hypothetical protein
MTEEPNAKQANKPNATPKEQQAVQELLEKLGLPTQPPASAAANAYSVSVSAEGGSRPLDVAAPHSASAFACEGCAHSKNVPLPQLPPEVAEALTRGSVEVDVRPCGGACGRRRGLRVSPVEYLALVYLRGVLGYRSFCDVLRDPRFVGLFCGGRRGRGVDVRRLLNMLKVLKELLRVGSREGPYAASYLLKRIYDGVPYYDVVDGLVKKLAGSIVNSMLTYYLRRGVLPRGVFDDVGELLGAAEAMLNGFAWELGFSNLAEFAQHLQLIVLNLVEPRYANRHGGYRDILGATCRLCGIEFNTTKPVLRVLWDLAWHFKHAHGLKSIEDVEAKVKELRERGAEKPEGDVGVKLLRHSGEVNQLIRLVVHRLVDRGLFERIGKSYRCRACNSDVGDAIEALVHALDHHYDVVNKLLSGRVMPSVDGFDDAVDELANLFSSGNPDAVRHTVKALVQGVVEVLNVKGAISIPMLTRVLNESEDYRPLIDSLATDNMKADRVVAVIVDALARHGLVQVSGEVVSLGD